MMMMMKLIKKLISLGELGQTTKQAQLQKYNKDVRTSRFSRSDTRFISRVGILVCQSAKSAEAA